MNVAVLIMASDKEPSTSNLLAMNDTFINDTIQMMSSHILQNNYDFFIYTLSGLRTDNKEYEVSTLCDHINYIDIAGEESIYNTYEKTVTALKVIGDNYDWIVRLNISAFLNIKLLDTAIISDVFDRYTVYCNAINSYINDENYYNDLYPRGDFLIFSNTVRKGMLQHTDKYIRCDVDVSHRISVPHVDDCLLGLCLIDFFGPRYYEHLQMIRYAFLPMYENFDSMPIDDFAIASRVKTMPPDAKCSGYSWEENEWRKYDGTKMKYLNEHFKNIMYTGIDKHTLQINIIDKGNTSRKTYGVCIQPMSIQQLTEQIKLKRG